VVAGAYISVILPALVACATLGFLRTLYRERKPMSSTVHVTGAITITPPITHGELAQVKHLTAEVTVTPAAHVHRDAYINVTETVEDHENGTLIRRQGTAIVAAGNEFSHPNLNGDIMEIVDEFPDRQYSGYLECWSPDDRGDTWRVIVRDGMVEEIRPTLTWPDEQ
jgi:hypothetical protein